MSSAFVYGGIDRTRPSWVAEQAAVSEVSNANTHSGAGSIGRSSQSAYVYGGIDRAPVEWRSDIMKPDLSFE